MNIRVVVFDFDGCLFNESYSLPSGPAYHNVIKANQSFLDTLLAEKDRFDALMICNGSARQSKELDEDNAERNNTESCFTALECIGAYLDASLNKMLLPDIYHGLYPGTTFYYATKSDYEGHHPKCVFDETKFTLLYAWLHSIALSLPNDKLTFDFL